MTTALDLIEETRRHLFSGQQEEMNRLSGSIDDAVTSVTFKYDLGGISKNAIISVDLEEMLVWEVAGRVATVVQRGVNGTTAAAHSDLATVVVKPKFSKFRVLSALN